MFRLGGALKVSGTVQTVAPDAALSQATASYQRYVQSQTAALLKCARSAAVAGFVRCLRRSRAAGDFLHLGHDRLRPLQ